MSTTPNDSIDPEVERLAAELVRIRSRAETPADWPRWSDLTWELKEALITDAVAWLKIRREGASFTASLEDEFQGR
jgi:hypothetical protein